MPLKDAPEVAQDADPAERLRLGLPPRLLIGLAIAVLAIIFVGGMSYTAMERQAAQRTDTRRALDALSGVSEVLSLMKDAETGQRGFLITGREDYLQPYQESRAALAGQLDAVQQLVNDNPQQVQRVRTLRQLITEKLNELQQTIDVRRTGSIGDAYSRVGSDRGKTLMDQIRSTIGDFTATENGVLASRTAELNSAQRRSFRTVLGGLGVLLFLVLTAGGMAAREYERKEVESWLRFGQGSLARALQGEQRLELLGEHVLRLLTRQLDAAAGAFYVVDKERKLRRVAGFALNAEATETFAWGEGLVGEAARADRILQVTDLPAAHVLLQSALVAGPPERVVLVPMAYNGRVNAVLELALMRKPRAAELEMLERSRGSVGTAVNASRDRTRLEELLEETQQQSEELQTQQEELRVANEELQEQSQALKHSQGRLEQQQVELEQTNSQLEEQTRALEEHADRLTRGEADLVQRTEDLQRANEYKSEFLANMSHELRTPLNSTLILAKLLSDNKSGNLSEEQVRFASTIYSSGNDLLALINDILDLSKIEAGKMEILRESVLVARLTETLQMEFAEVARNKGLKFDVTVASGTPARIESDAQRVMQVLRNLLSNAFKFTSAGEVAVHVSAAETPAGTRVAFAVRDSGIGIAAEQHQAIFEAFRQADGSTHRKYGGTGLGLSISRDLAHLLGGSVTMQSAAGSGSTFTLWLPERTPQAAEPGADAPGAVMTAMRGHAASHGAVASHGVSASQTPAVAVAPPPVDERVLATDARVLLVIEDDPAFASILRDLAAENGFETVVAHTASEGLAAARAYRISAVLLDMHLPDRTGLSVLDELKRDPATRHVPVHAVSVADYSYEALSRGAVGYALKPVSREQVVEALHRLDERLSPGQRRVLVVEDDPRQRESVQHLLASQDVEIVPAETAARALELLREYTFDCMVLDLNLPDLSGYELLEKMGEIEGVGYPPVIVYTGRSLSRDEEQRLRRFSRSIIIKDARSPERLLDEVTLFLHQVEAELTPERQRMLRAARDREAAFEGRRILIVEDDVRNIFALSKLLEPRGARIDIARNGREAIEHLERTRGTDQAPDLVLMDIMMPEMDGLTATREIRKRPEWKRLPIIALTAKAMRDDQEKCLQAGASDYLAKPLNIERLLSLVRVWMPQ